MNNYNNNELDSYNIGLDSLSLKKEIFMINNRYIRYRKYFEDCVAEKSNIYKKSLIIRDCFDIFHRSILKKLDISKKNRALYKNNNLDFTYYSKEVKLYSSLLKELNEVVECLKENT